MGDPADGFDALSLKDLIRRVHEELYASQAERQAAGEGAIFAVGELVIEVHVVAVQRREHGGRLDFKIITSDGGETYEQHQVHKVTLTLNPLGTVHLPAVGAAVFSPREE